MSVQSVSRATFLAPSLKGADAPSDDCKKEENVVSDKRDEDSSERNSARHLTQCSKKDTVGPEPCIGYKKEQSCPSCSSSITGRATSNATQPLQYALSRRLHVRHHRRRHARLHVHRNSTHKQRTLVHPYVSTDIGQQARSEEPAKHLS